MRPIDGTNYTFSAEGNSPAVVLTGGRYELSAVCAAWNGAVLAVQHLLPDGSTWVADTTLVLTHANGVVNSMLSPGQYRLTVTTAIPTDPIYADLCRVPTD
jgi:hypothetical protein